MFAELSSANIDVRLTILGRTASRSSFTRDIGGIVPSRMIENCLVLSLICLIVPVFAVGQTMSPAEKDIWSLEQRFWDTRTRWQLEEHMTFWDDDFTGWPWSSDRPLTKAEIRLEILKLMATTRFGSDTVRLEPLSIRVRGDYAFAFYRVHRGFLDREGKRIEIQTRIYHTWWRTPEGWKIIACMTAPERRIR